MNREKYITNHYAHDPTRFGGVIRESDFDTNHRPFNTKGSAIAERIVSCWRFDEACRRNVAAKERVLQFHNHGSKRE